jgi:hypothetical protein
MSVLFDENSVVFNQNGSLNVSSKKYYQNVFDIRGV